MGVFEQLFKKFLEFQNDKLDTAVLNLAGKHSLVKKSGEAIGYQHRKKGRTSNTLIMTDGWGIPIAVGDIISGNHNDLYEIVPQLSKFTKAVNESGIILDNCILNADKGFDSKAFKRFYRRRKMIPNVKENNKNRKKTNRGKKPEFYQEVYKRRFVNERCFGSIESFRTLLTRFDTTISSWKNWHYLAFFLILIKV